MEKEVYLIDEDGSQGAVVHAYWTPTQVSGLFDTNNAARVTAVATLPWLRKAFGDCGIERQMTFPSSHPDNKLAIESRHLAR
ncbi:MAG: hypothetical protein EOO77_06315 [Oxalobacteraceae bacterium]|nr:MAG: hypothetical protein EOO77_06315 [Oxalobacteraceae bacterium]